MPTFLAIAFVTLLATFAAGRLPAGGVGWDLFDGLGYLAVALLAYLVWASPRPARGGALRLHIQVSILACVVVAVHAVGLLVLDPTVIEYFKPKAPPYMLAGLAAGIGMTALALTSPSTIRRRLFGHYGQFRLWHITASSAIVAGALWHVLGSAFYLQQWSSRVLLILSLAVLPAAAIALRRRRRPVPTVTRVCSVDEADGNAIGIVVAVAVLAVLFAAVRNF